MKVVGQWHYVKGEGFVHGGYIEARNGINGMATNLSAALTQAERAIDNADHLPTETQELLRSLQNDLRELTQKAMLANTDTEPTA